VLALDSIEWLALISTSGSAVKQWSFTFYYYCYSYLLELQCVATRWQWHCNKTQHANVHISPNAERKHSTQSEAVAVPGRCPIYFRRLNKPRSADVP
jgi:hypothetical protein